MDEITKLRNNILADICRLAMLRKDDCYEDADDKLIAFESTTDYGLGKAEFKFTYRRHN